MKVWIDGELKIDYKGVANYKKGKELHLKFGIYSSGLNLYRKAFGETKHKKRVIYFDGVKGETTCKKLLNDKKRCEELLITKPLMYKIYKPNNIVRKNFILILYKKLLYCPYFSYKFFGV